jgi:uncharacterized membrane protein YsdA (DUF1294 family)
MPWPDIHVMYDIHVRYHINATHRVCLLIGALASSTFSLNCYTKIDGAGVPGDWRRIAVCLPSLWRLPENCLRIMMLLCVLDEAGLLRRFFGSELMNHKIQKTYDRLSVIVANAPTVVVAVAADFA